MLKTFLFVFVILFFVQTINCVPTNYTTIEAQRLVGIRFFSALNGFMCEVFKDIFETGAEIHLPVGQTVCTLCDTKSMH